MKMRVLNIILGLLTVLSFVWAYLSEENRIIAAIIGFLLIMIILFSERNIKVQELAEEQKRLGEKLKIHEQLVDIKADIKYLQKRLK